MIKDAMGIIIANSERIPPITDLRAALALPMAGRYRVIDFILSSMSNAGIVNIGVATKQTYSSLMDHLKSGKPWDLDRKSKGLNILPPNLWNSALSSSNGDIAILEGIRDYIRRSSETYAVLCMGNGIYNIDFDKVMDFHIQKQADITLLYKDMADSDEQNLSRFTLLDVDSDDRVCDLEVKPFYPKTKKASMDIYVMEKVLLESIIDECFARGDRDFLKDSLAKKLNGLRVYACEHTGYADKIDSMKSYYRNNMMFLNSHIRNEIFSPERPIYTKTKDQAPAKYGLDADVQNSFVSDGCVIEGTVINSILSRGVRIAKGSVVNNSIIMQDSVLENDVCLDHVVFDKEVYITKGRKLLGQESYPLAIEKGTRI